EGTTALWTAEDGAVYLLQPQESEVPASAERVSTFGSTSEAISSLVGDGKNIGVEEEFIGTALALSLAAGETVPVQNELGHWRDVRDSEDLPFQVIAARTSVTSMENTLEWTNARIERGEEFTELDIYDKYLEELKLFTQ